MSSAYPRLLVFLPAILIPACASSSPAFLRMYSAYKLNKQGDNIQSWCTLFSIWNQFVVPCQFCYFLTCIQVSQEAGKVVLQSHLFKNFPQFIVIHTYKDFSIINEAEVDVFLAFPWFFYGWMLAIWSLVPLPFLNPACRSGCSPAHILLKPSLKDFEHYLASMWNECNCAVVWTFFGIAFLWNWNETDLFQCRGHCWVFQICWHVDCSILTESSFRICNSSSGIPSLLLPLFVVMLPKAYLTSL